MKTIYEWNNEYALYHKNKTNKAIHWVCIPLIMYSLFGLLSLVDISYGIENTQIPILPIFIALVILYYFKLSKTLAIGMLLMSVLLIQLLSIIKLANPDVHLFIFL